MSSPVSAKDPSSLPVESAPLSTPPLEDVTSVLSRHLSANYHDVSVTVVDCPDLTQPPWGLAAPGLGGSPRLLDVGGVPYLIPLVQRDRLYDMRDYPALCEVDKSLIIGAGAAPWPYLGRCAEMMPNLFVKEDGSVVQETHIARTHDHDGSYSVEKLPGTETRNSLLGNLFLCQGEPGRVVRVECKKRTGDKNLVTAMREALLEGFPGQSIGVGGVFHIAAGKVKIHVMPDFSACPLDTDQDVENWLKFYEMSAPFTVLSVLLANDPGLDVRVEHSHGWSTAAGPEEEGAGQGGGGGHYHTDTTPDEIHYVGYFNMGERCYRVDRPGREAKFDRLINKYVGESWEAGREDTEGRHSGMPQFN